MRQTTVYAGVSNLVQYGGIGVQVRDVGKCLLGITTGKKEVTFVCYIW